MFRRLQWPKQTLLVLVIPEHYSERVQTKYCTLASFYDLAYDLAKSLRKVSWFAVCNGLHQRSSLSLFENATQNIVRSLSSQIDWQTMTEMDTPGSCDSKTLLGTLVEAKYCTLALIFALQPKYDQDQSIRKKCRFRCLQGSRYFDAPRSRDSKTLLGTSLGTLWQILTLRSVVQYCQYKYPHQGVDRVIFLVNLT